MLNYARDRRWICCQLGAREHYWIPRGLHQRGLLAGLVTDLWVPPGSFLAWIGGGTGERLRQRFDDALADAHVHHASASALAYEFGTLRNQSEWDAIIARNNWFEAKAVHCLEAITQRSGSQRQIIFAYSYAARSIFQRARELGCTTVMGQIDPGPVEERIVSNICLRHNHQRTDAQRIPDCYWQAWREECEICDIIVVNSNWTRDALLAEGVSPGKVQIVPLAYDPQVQVGRFERKYPAKFSNARPLRVLFLGALIPRKGIYEVLDAAFQLRNAPVEFHLVGPGREELAVLDFGNTNVHWVEQVPRSHVTQFCQDADVFVFPTHSDGFGLTQLEAMAAGLPVIASKNCGEVVSHGINGLLLPTVTSEAIVESIEWCTKHPSQLLQMSDNAIRTSAQFSTDHVIYSLLGCTEDAIGSTITGIEE